MNTIVTSKEAILDASQKLALEMGLQSINIRAVAGSCGVSVGSIYNYFPSKADLIAATVEKVWEAIFHDANISQRPEGFTEYVVWLYDRIQKGSSEYPSFFTLHSMSFAVGDREKGRMIMERYFTYMKAGLQQVLSNDLKLRPDAFNESFTQMDFIDFVFSNVMSLSMQQTKNCDTLREIIKRTIYEYKGPAQNEF